MSSSKSKATPVNGAGGKGKAAKASSSPSASGTATPVSKVEEDKTVAAPRTGRPDKAAFDVEQERLKKEIDALQTKLNAVQESINAISGSGPGSERRNQLRAELDEIRQGQSQSKNSRGKIMDQLKAMNEGIQKKIKDLQAARAKTPYKSVDEVDARISQLDKQVESGNMKLADEKRALQEMSQIRRSRRTVESFQSEEEAIQRDKAAADELRKQLDDPEAKALHDRADAIKSELDEIKREGDEAYSNRSKLFDERNGLKDQVSELYRQKRESSQNYKDDNDRFYAKLHEDRARKAEKFRQQRAAEEEQKKKELSTRLLEEAQAPAFQDKIEDCQTLVDYFSALNGSAPTAAVTEALTPKVALAGVPKHDLRQVDGGSSDGLVVRKKKGEEEEAYFVMGKSKKAKGRKVQAKANDTSDGDATPVTADTKLNVPFSKLTALLSLSIPYPSSSSDLPRIIEDLKMKKAWYQANQARVTAENVAKAQADVQRLLIGAKAHSSPLVDAPPNGGAEQPPEPTSTPQDGDSLPLGVPSEDVDEKLESIQELTSGEEAVVEGAA